MTDKIVVLSTCASAEEAERIARRLLEKRLAACVNVVAGARSIYRWRGAIEEAAECLLIIKSRQGRLGEFRAEIEVCTPTKFRKSWMLAIVDGSPAYLDWLDEELAPEA